MHENTMGRNIRALRLQKGVTQEAMATRLGVTYQAVSKWETGVTMPDITLLPDIAVNLGVTIDALFSLSTQARLDRVENMLEVAGDLTPDQFDQAEAFLRATLAAMPDSARASWLLAFLYTKQADSLRAHAVPYAQNALALAPEEKAYHSMVVSAMGGAVGDYHLTRRYPLIAHYQAFLKAHPDSRRGHAFLFDQLLHDNRLDEAETVLDTLRRLAPRHVENLFFEGDLRFARGDHNGALALWDQGATAYDGPAWTVLFMRAGRMERLCRYEDAIADYQKAFDTADPPRYVDPLVAMSRLHELMGRYDRAADMREMEIRTKQTEWSLEAGEAISEPRREIERLRQRMAP